MMGYVEAPEAWWRINGMARNVGVSLPRAVTDGFLTRSELVAFVERCQTCGAAGACARWLEGHPKGSPVPAYCKNSADLTVLGPDMPAGAPGSVQG